MPDYFHGKGILEDLKKALAAARKYIKENPGEVTLGAAVGKILSDWGIAYSTKKEKKHVPSDHDHLEIS